MAFHIQICIFITHNLMKVLFKKRPIYKIYKIQRAHLLDLRHNIGLKLFSTLIVWFQAKIVIPVLHNYIVYSFLHEEDSFSDDQKRSASSIGNHDLFLCRYDSTISQQNWTRLIANQEDWQSLNTISCIVGREGWIWSHRFDTAAYAHTLKG